MYHHRKRKDRNHPAIVSALQSCGWVWLDTSQLGSGAPDGIMARAGQVVAVEIKAPGEGLRPAQRDWRATWPGPSTVLTSVDEALRYAVLPPLVLTPGRTDTSGQWFSHDPDDEG